MRKFVPATLAATAALVVLAAPAPAEFDPHFSVIAKEVDSSRNGDVFRFQDQLFQTSNPDNQVGNDRVRCREVSRDKIRCRALIHLNGEVGGTGFLRVNGNLGVGHGGQLDNRLNVLSGTGDFAGVAGKMIAGRHRLEFDLVR